MKERDELRTGATITLLKGPRTIIVNPGYPKDKDYILESLQKHDVSVNAVEGRIGTNTTVDSLGILNLFPNAVFIVSHDMCLGDLYHRHGLSQAKPSLFMSLLMLSPLQAMQVHVLIFQL